jgi:cardiolipin synthase
MSDKSRQQKEMNTDRTQDRKQAVPGSGENERVESKAAVKNGVARMIVVVLSILIEVIVIFLLLHYAGTKAGWIYVVLHIISFFLVLVIYGSHKTASIRMTWIMLIMLLPIVGTVMYFLISSTSTFRIWITLSS